MIYLNPKKIVIFSLCMTMLISCGKKEKNVDKIAIAEKYIKALNASDYRQIVEFFQDSIRLKELDYSSVFSKEDFYSLFQWDSTFSPKYKLLEVRKDGNDVHMKVSKACNRILFLHEEPIVTHEVMRFKENKIGSLDIVEYLVFNDSIWSDKRALLVSWIDKNHPELNGFLYDQSKRGAENYLLAIELYRREVDSKTIEE